MGKLMGILRGGGGGIDGNVCILFVEVVRGFYVFVKTQLYFKKSEFYCVKN